MTGLLTGVLIVFTAFIAKRFGLILRWLQALLLLNWAFFVWWNVNYASLYIGHNKIWERCVIPFLILTTVAGFWSAMTAGTTLYSGLLRMLPSCLLSAFPFAMAMPHADASQQAGGMDSVPVQENSSGLLVSPTTMNWGNDGPHGAESATLTVAISFWIMLLSVLFISRQISNKVGKETIVVRVPKMPQPWSGKEELSRDIHVWAFISREVSRYTERTAGIRRASSGGIRAPVIWALILPALLVLGEWLRADTQIELHDVLAATLNRYWLETDLWKWSLYEASAVGFSFLLAIPLISQVTTVVDQALIHLFLYRRLKLMREPDRLYQDLMYAQERGSAVSANPMGVGGSSSILLRPREIDEFGLAARIGAYLQALSAAQIRLEHRDAS